MFKCVVQDVRWRRLSWTPARRGESATESTVQVIKFTFTLHCGLLILDIFSLAEKIKGKTWNSLSLITYQRISFCFLQALPPLTRKKRVWFACLQSRKSPKHIGYFNIFNIVWDWKTDSPSQPARRLMGEPKACPPPLEKTMGLITEICVSSVLENNAPECIINW